MRRRSMAAISFLFCALALAALCGCTSPDSSQTVLVVLERESTTTPPEAPTMTLTPTDETAAQATATPTLIPGMGCLIGQAVTLANRAGIPGTTYYLAPALGGDDPYPPVMYAGPDRERGHVPGISGPQGEIELRDVPPGRYYLAMWAPYDWVLAVVSPENEAPLLVTIEPGLCTDLGQICFPWP